MHGAKLCTSHFGRPFGAKGPKGYDLFIKRLAMKRKILSLLVVAVVAFSCSSTRTSTTTTSDNAARADTATTDASTATTTTVTTTTPATTTPVTDTSMRSGQTGTPTVIITSFQTKYPNAANVTWSPYDRVTIPIDWEMTGWTPLDAGDYVAEFDMNGQKYYAWYDASGRWIGSSSMLANHSDLPKAVRDLLVSKYNGYTIDKVEQEFDDNRMVYEIKLKKTDDDKVKLHVSEQGIVLKEKKKD